MRFSFSDLWSDLSKDGQDSNQIFTEVLSVSDLRKSFQLQKSKEKGGSK